MKFKEKQKNNGITLIALVITIIVLLILAGVTIATLFGDNGVLTKATEAKNEQADATVEEAVKLAWNEYQMMLNEPTGKNESGTKLASTSKVKIQGQEENYSVTPTMTFWQFLEEEKHYINEQGVIDVKTLVGETLSRGNGTDGTTDVYKIEETEDNGYVLVYYGEKSEDKTELATFTPGDSEILEETDPSLFEITDDGMISLKYYDDYYKNKKEWTIENVVIPKEINGIEVKKIGEKMFYANSAYGAPSIAEHLKSVVIPETVIEIGDSAFSECENLISITMSNTVTTVGDEAFYSCTGLINITIPDSVTIIGEDAFYGCTGLETIKVEARNTVYESPNNCNGIIEKETNTLLFGCKNTTIPNTVTTIGNNAFGICTGLTNIRIPDSVTTIGNEAFSRCTGLTNITIPNSVITIGVGAFRECTGLTNITISDSVTTIGNEAFIGCKGLTNITIPNSVITIEGGAFRGCIGITNISIPITVTEMGDSVFNNWTSSQTIRVPFKEGDLPEEWDSQWKGFYCDANIEYAQ